MSMEGKIKLIQVIADAKIGGGPKHVLGILKNINKDLFDVYLVCPPGYLSAEGKLISKIEVINFNPRSKLDLMAFLKLKNIFGLILTNNNPFGPVIIHAHGARAGLMARAVAPKRAKTVYTEHRIDGDYFLPNFINDWCQKKILAKQNHKTNLIIAVSSSVKKFLINQNNDLRHKIKLIPNAIDEDRLLKISRKRNLKTVHRAPVIGNIGNLNVQKGHIYLIEAMKKVRDTFPLATLEIIGDGEEKDILKDQIKRLDLGKNVTLYGYRHDIDRFMQGWDVFVSSSIAETFGIVILEAMQAGVPIVATKVGGVPDIITNQKNGILVESQNADAIAEGIIQVLKHPPLAAKLRREAYSRVREFSWKIVITELEKEYLKLFKE